MAKYRVNKPAVVKLATALTGIAGIAATFVNVSTSEPEPLSPEHQQSNAMRESIEAYFPLVRDMVMAAPATVTYPQAPQFNSAPQSMRSTFQEINGIISNHDIGQPLYRCDVIIYLRDIHRIATDAYVAARASNPDIAIDLEAHKAALASPPQIAPTCKIR